MERSIRLCLEDSGWQERSPQRTSTLQLWRTWIPSKTRASTEQSTCTTTNSTSASATNVNSDTRATSATSATNATSATSATVNVGLKIQLAIPD